LANGRLCGRPEGHPPKCTSEEAVAHANAQSVNYHRERNKLRYDKINAIKLAAGCIDCGYNEHPEALDFDHRDASLKVADISSMLNATWDAIMAELAKCDVRCAICHRIKTHRKPPPTDDEGFQAR
jgi:hypothetical protein